MSRLHLLKMLGIERVEIDGRQQHRREATLADQVGHHFTGIGEQQIGAVASQQMTHFLVLEAGGAENSGLCDFHQIGRFRLDFDGDGDCQAHLEDTLLNLLRRAGEVEVNLGFAPGQGKDFGGVRGFEGHILDINLLNVEEAFRRVILFF